MPNEDKPVVEITEAAEPYLTTYVLADFIRSALDLEGIPSQDAYDRIVAAASVDEAFAIAREYVRPIRVEE